MSSQVSPGYNADGTLYFPESPGGILLNGNDKKADIDLKTFEPSQPQGTLGASFKLAPVPQTGLATQTVSQPVLQEVAVPVAVPTFDFKTAAIAVVIAFLGFKFFKKRK